MTRAALGRVLGSRSRASEVLARRRPLTLGMIRKVHEALGIPADVLITEAPPPQRRVRASSSSLRARQATRPPTKKKAAARS
jgi:HTH-type transcriptional regulator/antitoxin HigA